VPRSAAAWSEYALASERVVLPPREDVTTDVTSTIGCAVMTGAGAIIITLAVRSRQWVAKWVRRQEAGDEDWAAVRAAGKGYQQASLASSYVLAETLIPQPVQQP